MAPRAEVGAESHIGVVQLRGVRQNNLRGVDLDLPLGQLIAISGVSGSGKSSLAFDTLYAEGQRRFAECLSTYARQFLERMDKPAADRIDGIVPTVALEQGRRLKAARSTVATLTEVSEYLRVVFAAAAVPSCPNCGASVSRARAAAVVEELLTRAAGRRAVVHFAVPLRTREGAASARASLLQAGLFRVFDAAGRVASLQDDGALAEPGGVLRVVVDRLRLARDEASRVHEAVEAAMRRGDGVVWVDVEGDPDGDLEGWALLRTPAGASAGAADGTRPAAGMVRLCASSALRCDACGHEVADPSPRLFSSSSPLGACVDCAGFGRTMAVDWDKVLPDRRLTLNEGAIKPWSTEKTTWERGQLEAFCRARGIDMDTPWHALDEQTVALLLDGDGKGGEGRYYGVREWFDWLETRTYRMHVRVLLARYRRYVPCATCGGSRLRPEVLDWRLEGRDLPTWLAAPIAEVRGWLEGLDLDVGAQVAVERPLFELTRRVRLLDELGVGYLTLDRAGRSLSGGELQRVQLVSALASGLAQVLYVLDEPSVGLHPRDNDRLLGILRRLQAGGNTVVIVEHDPALIRAADRIVDVGPAAGERGGQIVYDGPAARIVDAPGSLTGAYLAGRARVDTAGVAADVATAGDDHRAAARRIAARARDLRRARTQDALTAPWLEIVEPRARNLRGGTVRLLRGGLNVVCGVSGSGKSTLVEEVLHRHLLRRDGKETDPPGACEAIVGADDFEDVVYVEAHAGRASSRANAATLLKVWDAVRARFAAEPAASARGLNASSFSFNRPGGRCEACAGQGFETIDMQFLSDVRLRCEACEGQRFGAAALEVRHRGFSVADVLAMTAAEAAATFAGDRAIAGPLAAMAELGLGYLRLGQPLSSLSGGEAQRLEIARHLLARRSRRTLFLLDEPSTGLHLDDVRVLLDNLRRLVARGDTVVMIEHHLDLIDAADHLVELGPEGGPGGGAIVFQGAPAALAMLPSSPTGAHLARHRAGADGVAVAAPVAAVDVDPGFVEVRGARVHNLKDLAVDLPRDRFVVVTGVSGSGKSSLCFDVVFAEGQRRFLDCLSPYARQYLPPTTRPEVDSLRGVPPTIAIAQRTTRGGARSTVATLTEIWSSLRLLYARLGELPTTAGAALSRRTPAQIAAEAMATLPREPLYVLAPVIRARKGQHKDVLERLQREGERDGEAIVWAHVDGALCPVDALPELRRHHAHDIDAVVARVAPSDAGDAAGWPGAAVVAAIERASARGDGSVRLRTASSQVLTFELDGEAGRPQRANLDPMLFSFTSERGWCPSCRGSGQDEGDAAARAAKRAGRARSKGGNELEPEDELLLRAGDEDEARVLSVCPACEGTRLCAAARGVTVHGRSIAALAAMTAPELVAALEATPWRADELQIAAPILAELRARVGFLVDVGLDYLALDRPAMTLSGGESQRIRLAAQLSSNLSGVLYVLDEPTIGLHPSDNARLLRAFAALVARGNGLLVVEHDEATIRAADLVVELGPGGGEGGGELLHCGPLAELLADPASPTGAMLASPASRRSRAEPRRAGEGGAGPARFGVRGATLHNLRGIDVALLRGRLNVVCGVSGSGKSSLVRDLLVGAGAPAVHGGELATDADVLAPRVGGAVAAEALFGLGVFGRVVEVDQRPIGRTPRSCPATYIGIWDEIRRRFAQLPEAKVLGLSASRFSFNTKGGRCESCAGAGVEKVELSFLPTVWVPCEACGGRRYEAPTLRPTLLGASIANVLEMSVAQAARHFAADRKIARPLELAVRMGLGYLRLGQGSNTLSGGEAQRLKLVAELATRRRRETLYVLDEPSTGLHLADQRRLMDVLQDLVERGDTLVVIEHNVDVMREADHLVELGPGGGSRGGRLLWQGEVAGLVARGGTPTAEALRGDAPIDAAGGA